METTIWILKSVVALMFFLVGAMKLMLPKAKLLDKGMKGLVELGEGQIKIAGALEVLGAIGLILPSALNYLPVLSAISALSLGMTMLVAGFVNLKLKLSVIPNIVILLICIFIFWADVFMKP